jgi:3,4-dihydroxy 2-butanone 4-phosphate synthase/GTP cyclohydrolase II
MKFSSVADIISDIADGKPVIVIDSEDRENEGDLVIASELATPETINFMAKEGRGLICVSLTEERAEQLDLEVIENKNSGLHKTNFTVSVDAKENTTTGISAFDRSVTIKTLISDNTNSRDLARPGHIFPIVGKNGGVLRRAGHTEASIDLATLAGLQPSGVICEIMADDGTMAKGKELDQFAKKHDLKIISIASLIKHLSKERDLVKKIDSIKLPTKNGEYDLHTYEGIFDGKTHLALTKGDYLSRESVLVRVHSECLTGDVFHSLRCDCGDQLDVALNLIESEGSGIVIYLRQEGRGIGLKHKIKAYKLQEEGLDTVEANEKLGFKPDLRDYGIGAQILKKLGAKKLTVLTNNPKKLIGLEGHGLEITSRRPIVVGENKNNSGYLKTKKEKLGHILR